MRMSLRRGIVSLAAPILIGGSVLAQSEPKPEIHMLGTRIIPSEKAGVAFQDVTSQTAAAWLDSTKAWSFANNRNIPDDVGAVLMPMDATLRSQLQVPEGQGLIVVEMAPDGRAAKAGLKVNDILLTLADKPVGQHANLIQILRTQSLHGDSNKPGQPLVLKFLRAGKPSSVNIRGETLVLLAPVTDSKPDYFLGLPATAVDETFRTHLDIPQGTGMIIGEITKDTPASKAGFKEGDILLDFDAQPVADVDTLRAKIQAKGPNPAELRVLRAGKPVKLTATPEARKVEATDFSATQLFTTLHYNVQAVPVLQDVPNVNRLYYAAESLAQPSADSVNTRPTLFSSNTPQSDLTKKIDDLTAQVQALTKAVESLRAAQVQGEKK